MLCCFLLCRARDLPSAKAKVWDRKWAWISAFMVNGSAPVWWISNGPVVRVNWIILLVVAGKERISNLSLGQP